MFILQPIIILLIRAGVVLTLGQEMSPILSQSEYIPGVCPAPT